MSTLNERFVSGGAVVYLGRMTSVPESRGAGLTRQREETVARLCEHFARDELTMEELERRLDLAHAAGSARELDGLVAGLPALRAQTQPAVREPPAATLEPATDVIVGVLGGAERRGGWTPGSRVVAVGVMGGVDLDFRDARLRPGVTDVIVVGFMGGVDIVVPPDLPVEIQGMGVMGGFGHPADARQPRRPGTPEDYRGGESLLRIRGVALMGGVDVDVRLEGETAGDARRRRRQRRRDLQRRRRELPPDREA